jgi:hypothetical protein
MNRGDFVIAYSESVGYAKQFYGINTTEQNGALRHQVMYCRVWDLKGRIHRYILRKEVKVLIKYEKGENI